MATQKDIYPREIEIAPSSDLRQKATFIVRSFEEVIKLQRMRYEILRDLTSEREERLLRREMRDKRGF
jgi:hypothetical protein